jgi:hypothetical protein
VRPGELDDFAFPAADRRIITLLICRRQTPGW